ncbi:hypothetical protein G6F31_018204 [Rhizopus arrhizus]|nr:hypothetical protein G6F31_018204 [Rhizopus arrhizus]
MRKPSRRWRCCPRMPRRHGAMPRRWRSRCSRSWTASTNSWRSWARLQKGPPSRRSWRRHGAPSTRSATAWPHRWPWR